MPSVGSLPARRGPAFSFDLLVTLLLAVALLVPLVVVPGTFFPYVVPRNLLFRVTVELAAATRIVEVLITGKRLDLRREYILLALIGFLLAITVSSVFSAARTHSFFGDFERMGGVWAWLHLAGFFLLLRTLDEKYITWLLHMALAVGVGASVHAIVTRISYPESLTIAGNPGLFAGYILIGLALAVYLANRYGRYGWLYLVVAAIELAALFIARNRSSVLGLLAGGSTAALVFAIGAGRRRRRLIPPAVAAVLVVGVVATIMMLRTGGTARVPVRVPAVLSRIAETDFGGVDAPRTFQWEASLAAFRERPLLGFGLENHHLVWSAHFDPRSEQIGVGVFDRAHNQYLEILATTGIFGAVAFVAIWGAIAYSLRRAYAERRLSVGELGVMAGANVAYGAYLVFWFVDINAAIIWLLLAGLIAARSNPVPVLGGIGRRLSRPVAVAGVVVTGAALAFIIHGQAYVPLRASFALATLDSYGGNGAPPTAAVETITRSPARQTSHFASVLSGFVHTWNSSDELDTTRSRARKKELSLAFQEAISAFDAELGRDPLNERLHTAAAQLLMEAATFYDSPTYLARAIVMLEKAIELSPRKTRQRHLLAKALADYSKLVERGGN